MSTYYKYPSSGGSGTVTSIDMTVPAFLTVSGVPITSSGTIALGLATEAANLVFAGPTTGAATTPTFRSLVAADLPAGAVLSVGAFGSTPSANAASISANVLTLQPADSTHPGGISLSAQTLGDGLKTLLSGLVVQNGGFKIIDTPNARINNILGDIVLALNDRQLWNSPSSITADFSTADLQVNHGLRLLGLDGANQVTVRASQSLTGSTVYSLELPQAQGGANQVLVNTLGDGVFNWTNLAPTAGDLTDAGTDGIVVTGGTGAVLGSGTSIAQHVADASHNGYLSSTDWSTFNAKQAALTLTNLTDAGTDGITITNGTGAVVGASPVTIEQHVADSTHNGYLSSTDWSTFNSKGSGTVTAVSVASANGFAGSSGGGATPALTLSTTITGILQGNGTAISAASTTGSGAVVLATNGVLVTPALGTPSALVGTNITGTASGLTAGTVTTNANLTGDVTSSGNATTAAATQANIVTLSKSTGVAVHGTNTNDNASAGYVGEVINANAGGSITPGNTNVAVNITSISLTAGDWDVDASVGLTTAGTTVLTNILAGISKTTVNFDDFSNGGFFELPTNGTTFAGTTMFLPTGRRRISISTTTTIYLVGQITYTTLSTTVWHTNSFLQARRVR